MTPRPNHRIPVLVTGAAGFLGSHLCDRLLMDGYDVTGIDNLQTGSLNNLASALESRKFHFERHPVTEVYNGDFRMIFNLACPASPPAYQADPIGTARTNFLGTYNLLELANRTHARFFLASTSEIYGDALEHPQTESYRGNVNSVGPRACYDEGKRIAETLCFDYQRMHAVEIRVARIFNTFGPRMNPHDGRVISNFITQALANDPITIYGDGSQTRSFCYVDDMIDGFMAMMLQDGFSGPVNLGNPCEFSILELAGIIIELTGSRSKLAFKSLPMDDPRMRRPDIAVAESMLGWLPKVSLRDGLKKMIAAYVCDREKNST